MMVEDLSASDVERPSIATNSFARLMSDGALVLFGLVAGVITARWLTPSGKGIYAALTYLVVALGQASSLGLGDASVILLGRKQITLQQAVSASIIPILVASGAGCVVLTILSDVQLGGGTRELGRSVDVAMLTVPIFALFHFLTFIVNSQERIVTTSIIRGFVQFATLVALAVFVILVPLHVTGSMIAGGIATSGGLMATTVLVRKLGLRIRPMFDLGFLKSALRLGLSIQLAYLVMSLAARIDVLFVYSLAGRAAAGRYSVALTVGFLGAYASSALAFVLFPRLAQLEDADASKLALRASRVGIAASLTAAAVMAVVIPFVMPIVFGAPYRSSVVPALILLVGGILWAEQLLLARAQLARGNTRLQLTSFGSALIVMIGLDVLLIPRYGINGAAIASTVAPGVGLIVCLMAYRRLMDGALKLNALLPRREDFRLLVDFVRTILRGGLSR